jgi:hypothetical protein
MITVTAERGHRVDARRRLRQKDPVTLTRPGVPGRLELLALAQGLVASARQRPGMVGITTRSWELMASSDTFEAWVIGWPPGGTIALHDHGRSAAAVVVAAGELVETTVECGLDGSATTATRRMPTDSSWTMAGRHVHDIVNDGPAPALSVHVYAPRLTSMTNYRLVDGHLRPEQTIHYRLGHVVP